MQSVQSVNARLLIDGCLTLSDEGCRSRHSRTSHAPASSAKGLPFRILSYFKSVSIFIVTLRLYFYS